MYPRFEVVFMEDAKSFLKNLDKKVRTKIIYNIDKARFKNDPKMFKKLNAEVWEFRTKYNKLQYRLLAFWDKNEKKSTLVIATHGIVKKQDKVPKKEILKTESLRKKYFDQKNN